MPEKQATWGDCGKIERHPAESIRENKNKQLYLLNHITLNNPSEAAVNMLFIVVVTGISVKHSTGLKVKSD